MKYTKAKQSVDNGNIIVDLTPTEAQMLIHFLIRYAMVNCHAIEENDVLREAYKKLRQALYHDR